MIRPAQPADAEAQRNVESAAGARFLEVAMADVAADDPMSSQKSVAYGVQHPVTDEPLVTPEVFRRVQDRVESSRVVLSCRNSNPSPLRDQLLELVRDQRRR